MAELRKDTVSDTWVVFSGARSRRPRPARGVSAPATPREACPFCPGHEGRTPPEVLAYRAEGPPDSPGWRVRCVPNEYPALEAVGEVRRRKRPLFESVTGAGAHEVVIETPEHDASLATLPDAQVEEVLRAYRDRIVALGRDRRVAYVLAFENHGGGAGASQSHPHSQLIATPIVPRRVLEEMGAARRHARASRGACVWCDLIRAERKDGARVVSEDDAFVAVSPFAARFPYETWILPRAHARSFEAVAGAERSSLARMLKDVLGRIRAVLDDPPYNLWVHTGPRGREATPYHWHLEVAPQLAEAAGFERGTGFFINPVLPEDAAAALRGGRGIEGASR